MPHTQKNQRLSGRLALFSAAFIWGTSFVVMKNTLASLSTLYLLALRFGGAALLLAAAGRRELSKLDAGYWQGGALMGLCLFLAYVFQTYGLLYTTPGVNAFLTAAYCIFVPFLNWALRGKRPGAGRFLAAAVCLGGVGCVSLQSQMRVGPGEGLTLGCGLFFALHIILSSVWVEKRSPLLLTAVQFLTAAVLSFAAALIFEDWPLGIPAAAVWSVAYLCVMCTAAGFWLQTFGMKHTPPTASAIILSLESVFGVLISILVGERPSPRVYLGFLLIFLAVLISETRAENRSTNRP